MFTNIGQRYRTRKSLRRHQKTSHARKTPIGNEGLAKSTETLSLEALNQMIFTHAGLGKSTETVSLETLNRMIFTQEDISLLDLLNEDRFDYEGGT
jgi:hypothetical protein